MKKILFAIIIIALIFSLVIIIKNQTKPLDQNEIVIGAPLSLTGAAATDGTSIKHGIDMAVDDLASRGIKVRIIYQDDLTDPKQTISAINNIMSSNSKVDALIGPTWSFLLDASASTIEKYGVVSYSPANTSEFISARSPQIFFGAVKNSLKIEPTIEWLDQFHAYRVAIIVDKSAWGESNLIPFKEAVKKVGATIILEERVPFGAEKDTFPTILAKIKALKPDAILTTGYDDGFTILINKMHEMDIQVPTLMASALPPELVQRGLVSIKADDEMYYTQTQISDEFSRKYYEKYEEYPSTYSDSAYDGVMMIVKAIQSKSPNESLSDYLRSPNFHYDGYQTNYSFDESGDIKGGEWIVKKLGN